ncbi:MAG: methyltransferase [Bacilli bacterium]|nr:methyltransferase [Bacilli bacterium]
MSQYFEENKELIDNKKIITINFKDKYYKLYTNNGVFSKDKLDYGTKLLLENITENDLTGNILDLGCGYGIIGIILATTYPNSLVDMCDITDRAISLSKENSRNLNLNNTNIFKSNIYENINKKYNYIITNPPIRAGKEIIRIFLFDAKEHLKNNGELWFVMRKDHGVKTMIKELEKVYDIEIKDKSKGFYIVICRIK